MSGTEKAEIHTDPDVCTVQSLFQPAAEMPPRKNVQRPRGLQPRAKAGGGVTEVGVGVSILRKEAIETNKAGGALEKQHRPRAKWEAVGSSGEHGEPDRAHPHPLPVTAVQECGFNAARAPVSQKMLGIWIFSRMCPMSNAGN